MKYLIFKLLIISPLLSFCQNKIDGIGQFRIGKTTTAAIDQMANDKNVKINTASTSMDRYLADGETYKITKNIFVLAAPSGDDFEDPHFKHSKDVKVYLIDYMEISGVPFSKLYLSFYKDTLYSIYSEGRSEIREAMTTKYGEPVLKVIKKKIKCTSRLAGTFEVEQANYDSQWATGFPAIKAILYTGVYYNSKCEKMPYSYFNIKNEALDSKIKAQEEILIKEKEAAEKERNKKALSNF